MKVIIKSVLGYATEMYKFVLLPPSLENTRITRKARERRLDKPDLPIKKRKKRTRRRRHVSLPSRPTQTKEGWALSTNEEKGIYFATKVTDIDEIAEEECCEDPNSINPSPEASNGDKHRISELEKQLAELKKSLSSLQPSQIPPPPPLSAYANLPPPPPPIALQPRAVLSVPSQESLLTPCFDSPCAAITVPAPDFDQILNTETTTTLPTPPPPPPIRKSKTVSDFDLVRVVPAGLHRTQSITDLIRSGEASTSILKKVEIVRSPGGTPVKAAPAENFLAKALRKKFRSATSPKQIYKSATDKENSPYCNNARKQGSSRTPSDSIVADSEWDWESPVNSPSTFRV